MAEYRDCESRTACDEARLDLAAAEREIERLRAENENLRRWKALDKPLTAAMAIANGTNTKLRAKVDRLSAALINLIADLERNDLAWRASVADARAALAYEQIADKEG